MFTMMANDSGQLQELITSKMIYKNLLKNIYQSALSEKKKKILVRIYFYQCKKKLNLRKFTI